MDNQDDKIMGSFLINEGFDPGQCEATSSMSVRLDLSRMTCSPLWRPRKKTDHANTQEAHYSRAEGERDKDNMHKKGQSKN